MNIKKIKKLKVNAMIFDVVWNKKDSGGSVNFQKDIITIGCHKAMNQTEVLEVVIHELFEIVCVEMHTRYSRTDCHNDYLFVFDHKQHTTQMTMMAGLLEQFIQ